VLTNSTFGHFLYGGFVSQITVPNVAEEAICVLFLRIARALNRSLFRSEFGKVLNAHNSQVGQLVFLARGDATRASNLS
jgi:hypothetical protein